MGPQKRKAPEVPGADATTYTITTGNATTNTDAAAFGVMMDRPLTTTRTCAGQFCWCKTGAYVDTDPDNFYWNHRQYMDGLAVRIRRLEIEQGPVL